MLTYEKQPSNLTSVEGQASKIWSKLPQDILRSGQDNGWQSITKDCQRFLTGKKSMTPLPTPRRRSKKGVKDFKNILVATALSDGNSSLNNELNVKLDYNSIVQELKGVHEVYIPQIHLLMEYEHGSGRSVGTVKFSHSMNWDRTASQGVRIVT